LSAGHFVDTSVWIDYFRRIDFPGRDFLIGLIEEDGIYIDGTVVTELLSGARTDADATLLASCLRGFRFVAADEEFFIRAGGRCRLLRTKGVSVPLSDLLIASHCLDGNLILLARDRHFEAMAVHLPLRLHTPIEGSRP
jgi:predicted nucleic acid-binding protein